MTVGAVPMLANSITRHFVRVTRDDEGATAAIVPRNTRSTVHHVVRHSGGMGVGLPLWLG